MSNIENNKSNILLVSATWHGALVDFTCDLIEMLSYKYNIHAIVGTRPKNMDLLASAYDLNLSADKKAAFNPRLYVEAKRYAKSTKAQVVLFCSGSPLHNIFWHILPIMKRIAYVHDPFPHSGMSRIRLFLYKNLLEHYYREADLLLFSSSSLRATAIRQGLVEEERSKVALLTLLRNHTLDLPDVPKSIDLLMYGRIEYYKGIDVLFSALRILNKDSIYPSVVLLGKGDLNKVYPSIGEIPPNVTRIERYVEDAELVEYICRSRLVVLPYRDATGTQIIQSAYYCGTPVLVTATGGLVEYANPEIGFVTNPGSAEDLAASIRFAMSDYSELDARGEAAKEFVLANFSLPAVSASYCDALDSVLSKVV